MTDEEIQDCGWLRPLSNKEVLGICLLNRASCLRSMKQHDDEIKTWSQALRYVPDTPLMQRVIAKNQELARNLPSIDRCNDLCNELNNTRFPTGGPKCEYFRYRKQQVQFFMIQSTNLAETEKSMSDLINEVKQYLTQISDLPGQKAEAFSQPKLPPDQQQFFASLRDVGQVQRVRLPEGRVPLEYQQSIPAELMNRLRKLKRAEEMIVEMQMYAMEEMQLHNLEAKDAMNGSLPETTLPHWNQSEVYIRPEDLPQPWRGRPIPPKLQARLANLNTRNDQWTRNIEINNVLNSFFIEQDQRNRMIENIKARRRYDPGPGALMGPPFQIEIVSSNMIWTVGVEPPIPSENPSGLPLTLEPQ
ncbi:MAG: hypothetical protein Q7J98_11555 [Kiritimatiellia bacterium]|nr:hypothetical protein [Kiritimatiellia bacterium]